LALRLRLSSVREEASSRSCRRPLILCIHGACLDTLSFYTPPLNECVFSFWKCAAVCGFRFRVTVEHTNATIKSFRILGSRYRGKMFSSDTFPTLFQLSSTLLRCMPRRFSCACTTSCLVFLLWALPTRHSLRLLLPQLALQSFR
jgi:hypothetical protein